MPFFIYDPDVKQFMEAFYELGIVDRNYGENKKKIENKAIEELTEKELVTLLTSIIRLERFCEGTIGCNLNDGTIQKILQRLREF